MINENMIVDTVHEWRAFSEEEFNKKCHYGIPTEYLLHDKGLSTIVKKKTHRDHRIFYLHKKFLLNTKDKKILSVITELKRIASILNMNKDILRYSALLCRKILQNSAQGTSLNRIAAACIYISCRKYNYPITLKDIELVTNINSYKIGRTYRKIKKDFNIRLDLMNPIYYIDNICGKMSLDEKIRNLSYDIIDQIKSSNKIIGKRPINVAAAIVYISSLVLDRGITQNEIANACNISSTNIRNIYKDILNELGWMYIIRGHIVDIFSTYDRRVYKNYKI